MGVVFQYEYGKGEFGGCPVDVRAETREEADRKARERVVEVYGDAFRPEELTYVGTAGVPAPTERDADGSEFVCRVPRRGRGGSR